MKFTKMHGLGNDFILIDHREKKTVDYSLMAKKLCDRHFGIGADGILLLLNSDIADIKMRIFNSDGSEAMMCGNGIRCFSRYIFENKILEGKKFNIETLSGIIKPEILKTPGINPQDPLHTQAFLVRVNMGKPRFEPEKIPVNITGKNKILNENITVMGEELKFSAVSMGNPHCVVFMKEIPYDFFLQFAPKIQSHPLFPQKTNVELAVIDNPSHITARVWERGAGETLACGTGACGIVAVAQTLGLVEDKVTVSLPGGDLLIEYSPSHSPDVFMTGPAVKVFEGTLD